MKRILDQYEVNRSTMALIPATHMDYCTIVLEENQQLFVRQTPSEIIESACIEGGASYHGRRKAVSYCTGYNQKVPIPINPRDHIFAFPTLSPNVFECNWIFYHHVKFIKSNKNPNDKTYKTLVYFKNGQYIALNESQYILEKQMERTAMCILRFSKRLAPTPTVL